MSTESDEVDQEFSDLVREVASTATRRPRVKRLVCGRAVSVKPETVLEWQHVHKGIERTYQLRYGTPPGGQWGADASPRFWVRERVDEKWEIRAGAPMYMMEALALLAGWKRPELPAPEAAT